MIGRRVSAEVKARIVALSHNPDVTAAGLAQRFGISPKHVQYLIRAARAVDSPVFHAPERKASEQTQHVKRG